MSTIWKRAGWALLLFLATLMFLLASRYLTLDPAVFFPQQRAVYITHMAGILIHIVGSMVATILGPFQFLPRIRTGRYRSLHRWLGRTYLVGVLFGGLGGLYMAFWAYGGFPARLGFALLALVWLGSGTIAYQRIRTQQIESHRQWMMRNYALTFAAVTLRLWQVVFQITGVEFDVAYVIVAWLCWIPNLLVAEWMVGRKPGQYNSNGSASPADHH